MRSLFQKEIGMSILDTIGGWFNSQEPPTYVSWNAVLEGWLRRVAAHFRAQLRFDEDGDAELTVHVHGEARKVLVMLRNDTVHVFSSSIYVFAPDRLPPAVAAFLEQRNQKLDFASWAAVNNSQRSFFWIKTHGRMDAISALHIQAVIDKMLPEVIALDRMLEVEGYIG
jgi:hypothetical protein